jgi:TonB-linked SusC/RagA family outer membrane protein
MKALKDRNFDSILTFAMRAGVFYMVLVVVSMEMLVAMPGGAQDLEQLRVTVELHDGDFKTLFEQIQSQTPLLFAYQSAQLDSIHHLTISKQLRSVKETLDLAFAGTNLSYRAVNNSVIVFKKEPAPPVGLPEGLHYVTGKVTDKTGAAIPGVNILIRGTSEGTVTDAEGKYSLQVNESDILLFTFIGFKRVEMEVGERTVIDITLEEDATSLKEVTINGGYYETTDELKTGSIVKVTAKDIEKQPVTSPLMALQGRVAGLEITPSAGAPGTAPKIRIRGTNSLRIAGDDTDGNYPLYIIDGVPVNSAPLNSMVNLFTSYTKSGFDPLSTINPANIASIEVLKDADATAIYGSRGANGVVLITTKTAKSKGKASLDFTTYAGVGAVSKKVSLLDTKQYLRMRREALANDGVTPGQYDYDIKYWDTTRYTDWQKLLIGNTANIADAQASLSAGTERTSFRFGGGYHRETLVFPGDFGYNRANGSISVNHISDNSKFRLSASINYGLDNSRLFSDAGGVVNAALTLPPFAPNPYNPDGSINWQPINNGTQSTWTNPMSSMLNNQKVVTKNLMTNAIVGYEIFPRMHISTNIGYTDLYSNETITSPKSAAPPELNLKSGTSIFNTSKRSSWIIEPKLNYTRLARKHEVSMLAGATWQVSTGAYTKLSGSQYASDALLTSLKGAGLIVTNGDDFTDYRYMSFYARLGYNYNAKYLINLTARSDGSSRFGSGNRFGNFGSIGAAWVFSEETYVKNSLPFLNFGKLRTSFGTTGSDQIGDYGYYSLYELNANSYQGVKGLQPSSLYNPNYQWELTNKLEGAIELGFFENRLGLEVNWYRNRSSNQLVNYPLSVIAGFPSVLTNFNATIENSGWEVSIRHDVVNSKSWSWKVSANVSLPTNKLVRFDGIENSPYATVYAVGEPLSVKSLYNFLGVNKETGLNEFQDKNSDGVINNDDKSLYNLQPSLRYFGGLNNAIRYKAFELGFLLQFAHQTQAIYLPDLPGRAGINQPTYVLQRWQQSGDLTGVQRFATTSGSGNNFARYLNFIQSNGNVTDASFVRLKTLSLTYRVNAALIEKAHLSDAVIFVQGQNLFTLTPYNGLDPETGNTLPPLRMLTLGLQLKF